MVTKKKTTKKKMVKKPMAKNVCKKPDMCNSNCGGFAYFLGFLGAAIYYISTATSFWGGVLGFLKAIIWPVFLVYGLLKQLGL